MSDSLHTDNMKAGGTAIEASAGQSPHGHDPHLAHHFESREQQTESGKLGMWVFLATEILMFGGLFCAYSVYRANHPEIFIYAHQFLDKTWGGINTLVLICSSLTMAWGVRCAQLNQRRGLIICLILTLMGACGFLGIKYVEYKAKWEHGLLWGKYYKPTHYGDSQEGGLPADVPADAHAALGGPGHADAAGGAHGAGEAPAGTATPPAPAHAAATEPAGRKAPDTQVAGTQAAGTQAAGTQAAGSQPAEAVDPDAPRIKPAAIGPPGLILASGTGDDHHAGDEPRHVSIFFSVYFLMTGLHGLHVLIGMGLITWVLVRAIAGHFSSSYFVPVDLVGLYWHLVDLIWIFLFPLLYLIH